MGKENKNKGACNGGGDPLQWQEKINGRRARKMMTKMQVLTGLDNLRLGQWKQLRGYRLGLLSNQASLDRNLIPAQDILENLLPGHLKALFGPQHGVGGEDQDNMVETAHRFDRALGIPIFSLYADKREPSDAMLENLDLLVIDLQDVGTRVYTFASTMLHCLKAAAKNRKAVLVLDRPNPLGGDILEGPLLEPDLFSFVGPCRIPMRHGMTMGELARLFNQIFDLHCDLEIIPMIGWSRGMFWKDTGLPWLMPSPNLPRPESAYVYPGQVVLEGTNLSEGRGTCRPFEIFGAPYLDPERILDILESESLLGCQLQKYTFRPTFHKWEGKRCRGFHLHITDLSLFRPFTLSLDFLRAVLCTHKEDFRWKDPPYEYEYRRRPIDLILGVSTLRRELEEGALSATPLRDRWKEQTRAFSEWRRPLLLYS
jgi:uncharacterized protein YbbC (DUF1343 family)